MNNDLANGLFELLGAVFLTLNVKQLIHDKQSKGIHWWSSIFFTSWGIWNLWYYPTLSQWYSFAGGVLLAIVNVIWLALRVYYTPRCKAFGHDWKWAGHNGEGDNFYCGRCPEEKFSPTWRRERG